MTFDLRQIGCRSETYHCISVLVTNLQLQHNVFLTLLTVRKADLLSN